MLVVRFGGTTLSDLCFVGAALLALFSSARKPTPQGWMQVAVAVGLIATLIASIQSLYPAESISVGLRVLYIWTLWQWVARKAIAHPFRIDLAMASFCLGAAISAVAALAQLSIGLVIPGSEVHFGRAQGLQNHANGQGGVLAVAVPMAMALLWRRKYRPIAALCLLASVTGLVLCGSVTGMISAVVGAMLVLIMGRKSFMFVMISAAAIVGLAFLVVNLNYIVPGAPSPLTRLEDTTGNGSGESTLKARLESDLYALGAIAREPFLGVGLDGTSGGTFNGVTLTHNMLLLAWFQGGLLFVVALLVVLLFTACQLKKIPKDEMTGPTRVGLIASFVAAFSFSMTGPVLFERWFWLPVVLGLAMASVKDDGQVEAEDGARTEKPQSGSMGA